MPARHGCCPTTLVAFNMPGFGGGRLIRRILFTLLLAFVILMVLVWPLGQAGIRLHVKRGGGVSELALQDNALLAMISPKRETKPLERDQFSINWGHSLQPMKLGEFYRYQQSGGSLQLGLHLLWPTLAVVVMLLLLALSVWYSRRRRQRRLHRNLCVGCRYQLASTDGPCNECGGVQTDLLRRPVVGPVARNALLATLLCAAALTYSTVVVRHLDDRASERMKARVFDYSWYLETCTPRLDGEVFYARPGSGPDSLAQVLQKAGFGATVVLLPGDHVLYDAERRVGSVKGLRDAWLLGWGYDQCTLSIELEQAERVRIEGVTINCNNTPFIDARREGTALHLRGCRIVNYNSGAGGSNSIFATGSVLLLEACTFDGREGRVSSMMMCGNALDVRGENRVYARDTVFVDNDEIGRNPDMVLDNCRAYSSQRDYPPDPRVLHRNFKTPTANPVRGGPGRTFTGRPFVQALDDYECLKDFARTRSFDAWSDPIARSFIDEARFENDPEFWKRLLLHPDGPTRTLAQHQLRLPPAPLPEGSLEHWLSHLDKPSVPRAMVDVVLSNQPESREPLEAKAANGTPVEQGNANALLRLMDTRPSLTEIVRAQELKKPK